MGAGWLGDLERGWAAGLAAACCSCCSGSGAASGTRAIHGAVRRTSWRPPSAGHCAARAHNPSPPHARSCGWSPPHPHCLTNCHPPHSPTIPQVGWKHGEAVAELEAARKEKAAAFYVEKKKRAAKEAKLRAAA